MFHIKEIGHIINVFIVKLLTVIHQPKTRKVQRDMDLFYTDGEMNERIIFKGRKRKEVILKQESKSKEKS